MLAAYSVVSERARAAIQRVRRAIGGLADGGSAPAAFLPDAFTQQSGQVLPAARAVVWLSVGLVLAGMVWAGVGSVDRVMTAEGKVRPASHVQIINHPRGGRVAAIHVASGDRVAKGQALLQFDPVAIREELNKLRPQRLFVDAELARLVAERDGQLRPEFSEAVLAHVEIAGTQAALFTQRLASFEQQKQTLAGAMKEKAALLEQQQVKLAHAKRGLAIAEKQERAVLDLAQKGYFAKIRAMQVQRDVSAVRSDIAQTEALVVATAASLSAAEARLAQFERDRSADILGQIAVKQTGLEQVTAAIAQLEDQLGHLTLTSPVAGTVEQLVARTTGQAIEPGAEIMHIVPDGGDYLVDAQVQNQDIGHIKVGQAVTLKMRAYDYQRHGVLRGEVLSIASDSTPDPRTGQQDFIVQIKTEGSHVGSDQGFRIQSGMLAAVDFHVGSRTVLGYVIDAVRRTTDSALRE